MPARRVAPERTTRMTYRQHALALEPRSRPMTGEMQALFAAAGLGPSRDAVDVVDIQVQHHRRGVRRVRRHRSEIRDVHADDDQRVADRQLEVQYPSVGGSRAAAPFGWAEHRDVERDCRVDIWPWTHPWVIGGDARGQGSFRPSCQVARPNLCRTPVPARVAARPARVGGRSTPAPAGRAPSCPARRGASRRPAWDAGAGSRHCAPGAAGSTGLR